MRNPNGYGSVIKLSGNRRRPWAARITVGWKTNEETQKAYPIYKFIGYYEKREDAVKSLNDFNRNPYDLNDSTLATVYEKWMDTYEKTKAKSTVAQRIQSWKHLKPIKDIKLTNLSKRDVQLCFDGMNVSSHEKQKVIILLRLLLDYAIRYDIISAEKKLMLRYIDLTSSVQVAKVRRSIFTKEEIDYLHNNGSDIAKVMLFLIYTGLRSREFTNITEDCFDEENKTIRIKKSKTKSGIRTVPLSDKALSLLPLPKMNYGQMWYGFDRFGKKNGMEHNVHDTRHTCISLLVAAGVDQRIIHAIVGHKGNDVTENVYTHIDIETMREALNKI